VTDAIFAMAVKVQKPELEDGFKYTGDPVSVFIVPINGPV
jgi:hypothetical protein